MPEENLDIKSPYLKNSLYNSRKRGENFISLDQNLEKMKEASDNLLRKKITNISKRVVGEEIRKFSEIASQEISEEFTNLEERVQNNTLRYTKNFLEKNLERVENSLQKDLYGRMDSLQDNLEASLNVRVQDLNDLLYEIETKLEDFELLSEQLNEKLESLEYLEETSNLEPEEKNSEEEEEILETPAFKIAKTPIKNAKQNSETKNSSIIILGSSSGKKPTLLLEEAKRREEVSEREDNFENVGQIFIKTAPEKETSKKSIKMSDIEDEMKKIIFSFEKKGFLFKKNNFMSHFKNLKVADFLEKKNYASIDRADEEKLSAILEEKISQTKLTPRHEEKIEEFLRRCLA